MIAIYQRGLHHRAHISSLYLFKMWIAIYQRGLHHRAHISSLYLFKMWIAIYQRGFYISYKPHHRAIISSFFIYLKCWLLSIKEVFIQVIKHIIEHIYLLYIYLKYLRQKISRYVQCTPIMSICQKVVKFIIDSLFLWKKHEYCFIVNLSTLYAKAFK